MNTYLFEAIDAGQFPWMLVNGSLIWISYVKFPAMILFCADVELGAAITVPDCVDAVRVESKGTINARMQNGILLGMIADNVVQRTLEIQRNYERIPKKQLTKMIERIQSTPNKEQYSGHRTYTLDKALLDEWLAANVSDDIIRESTSR